MGQGWTEAELAEARLAIKRADAEADKRLEDYCADGQKMMFYSYDNEDLRRLYCDVAELLKWTNFENPPTDIEKIARQVNIFAIKEGDEPYYKATLCIRPKVGGYEIRLDRGLTSAEKNFYTAHEIGHVIVSKARQRKLQDSTDYAERLCDYAAEQMLIPLTWLNKSDVIPKKVTAKFFTDVSDLCQLPIYRTCERFCHELFTPEIHGTIIRWSCDSGKVIPVGIYWLNSGEQPTLLDYKLESPKDLAKSALVHNKEYEENCLVSLIAPDGEKIKYTGTIAQSSYAEYLSYFPEPSRLTNR